MKYSTTFPVILNRVVPWIRWTTRCRKVVESSIPSPYSYLVWDAVRSCNPSREVLTQENYLITCFFLNLRGHCFTRCSGFLQSFPSPRSKDQNTSEAKGTDAYSTEETQNSCKKKQPVQLKVTQLCNTRASHHQEGSTDIWRFKKKINWWINHIVKHLHFEKANLP